ncbi:MAG: hypothetical protein R2771_12505 [Saprospiraceae bacterium]
MAECILLGTFRWEEGINVIEGDSLLPMHHYIQGYGEWQADHTIFTVIKDIEQDSFILKSTSRGSGDNKIYDVEMNEKGELMVCGKCIADTFMVNNETIDAPRKSGYPKRALYINWMQMEIKYLLKYYIPISEIIFTGLIMMMKTIHI